jgi:hypothetical protein
VFVAVVTPALDLACRVSRAPQNALLATTAIPEADAFAPAEGKKKKILAVVVTSDRGLCGGVNSSVTRAARSAFLDLKKNHDLTVWVAVWLSVRCGALSWWSCVCGGCDW